MNSRMKFFWAIAIAVFFQRNLSDSENPKNSIQFYNSSALTLLVNQQLENERDIDLSNLASVVSVAKDVVLPHKLNRSLLEGTTQLIKIISKLEYETSPQMIKYKTSQVAKSGVPFELSTEASLNGLFEVIIDNHLKDCDLIVASDRSFRESSVVEKLAEFQLVKQLVQIESSEDLAYQVEWTSLTCQGIILLMSDPEPLIEFGKTYRFQWSYNAKVIIVGLNIPSLERFLQTMKGKKTEHIIGVVKDDNHKFKIFMNLLYWGEGLEQITTWREETFTKNVELFPVKTSNLRRGVVKVFMFELRPFMFMLRDSNGTVLERHGRDILIVETLAEIFNFTLVYVDIEGDWGIRLPNGSFTGLIGHLGRDEGQIGLAYLYASSLDNRHHHQDYSSPIEDDKGCFLTRIEPPLPPWQNPSLPFQPKTWIAFAVGLLVSGPVFYLLVLVSSGVGDKDNQYKSIVASSLGAFGIHFNHPLAVLPKRLSTQIFIAFLLIYSLVLSTGYRSNLTSFLTIARTSKRLETIRDVYYSGLPIKGFQFWVDALRHSGNPYLEKLLERYEVKPRFEEIIEEIMSGKVATINSKSYLEVLSTLMRTKRGKPLVRFVKECLSTFSVGLGYQMHSPMKIKFDKVIANLVESGIVRKWFLDTNERYRELVEDEGGVAYYPDYWHESTDGLIPLGMSHMQGIFAIFALGYFLSTAAFALEIFIGSKE